MPQYQKYSTHALFKVSCFVLDETYRSAVVVLSPKKVEHLYVTRPGRTIHRIKGITESLREEGRAMYVTTETLGRSRLKVLRLAFEKSQLVYWILQIPGGLDVFSFQNDSESAGYTITKASHTSVFDID